MKRRYIALAKCVVVSQQEKQQTELSDEESNETTDKKITNGSAIWSTTTTSSYYCDHGHLHDQYEDQYKIIATTLNADDKNILENIVDEQKRWRKVIIEAMEVQQAKHYKQSLNLHHRPILENNNNQSINVQILKMQCFTRTCTEIFVVLYNDKPIPAEVKLSFILTSLISHGHN
ncbi:hypothetical protein ACH3XW_44815 [Acanthocheilonema viteae]